MTLKDELEQLDIDMKYAGKAYEAYYRMGLTIPFLYYLAGDNIGNMQYLSEIGDLNNIDPIRDSVAINKIGGVLKDYIDLTVINDLYNLDWFDGLQMAIESDGYINGTPVNLYIKTPTIFKKYCEFILDKNDYNFIPTEADIEFAKDLALQYSKQEMNLVFNK